MVRWRLTEVERIVQSACLAEISLNSHLLKSPQLFECNGHKGGFP